MTFNQVPGNNFRVVFLGQIAPRLLIRSDLERFFGVEGSSIQYAGITHNTLQLAFVQEVQLNLCVQQCG